MGGQKVLEFFKKNLSNIVLIALCGVYILKGFISIDESGKSPQSIIADGAISFIFSIGVKTLMRYKGILLGYEDQNFKATCNLYGEQLSKMQPYVQYLSVFCIDENKARIKEKECIILSRTGVLYEDYISGKYDVKPVKPKKMRAFEKAQYEDDLEKFNSCNVARKVDVYPYTMKLLNNAYDSSESEEKLLRANAKEFQVRKNLVNVATGVLFGLIFGYFAPSRNELALSGVIWAALQTALYLVFGYVEQNNAYEFVTKTLREKIKYVMTINDKFLNIKDKYMEVKKDGKNE